MNIGNSFGTDGVRGVANKDLTAELAYKLGQAGAYVLTSELNSRPKVLVGMDTRISGDMLKSALVAGLCSVGANAVYLGVVPTPLWHILLDIIKRMQVLLFLLPTILLNLTESSFSTIKVLNCQMR